MVSKHSCWFHLTPSLSKGALWISVAFTDQIWCRQFMVRTETFKTRKSLSNINNGTQAAIYPFTFWQYRWSLPGERLCPDFCRQLALLYINLCHCRVFRADRNLTWIWNLCSDRTSLPVIQNSLIPIAGDRVCRIVFYSILSGNAVQSSGDHRNASQRAEHKENLIAIALSLVVNLRFEFRLEWRTSACFCAPCRDYLQNWDQEKQQQSLFGTKDIWIRGEGGFVNIDSFDPKRKILEGITFFYWTEILHCKERLAFPEPFGPEQNGNRKTESSGSFYPAES